LTDFLIRPGGGWRGLVTLLGVGVVGNLVAALVTVLTGTSVWALILSTVSILVLLAAVWAISRRSDLVLVPKEQRPDQHPGLIVLVGTGREGEDPMKQSAGVAIEHHRPALKVCWLIASRGEKGSLPVAQELEEAYEAEGLEIRIRTVADAFDVQESYDRVERIYADEVPKAGLTEAQVIADFTGGTKPMSAGMILACGEERPMEYTYGRKDGIASMPRRVDLEIRAGRATRPSRREPGS
jgi:hypothetical protein